MKPVDEKARLGLGDGLLQLQLKSRAWRKRTQAVWAALSPELNSREFLSALEAADARTIQAAVDYGQITEAWLRRISESTSWVLRRAVAQSPAATPEMLATLSTDEDKRVREAAVVRARIQRTPVDSE